MPQKRSSSRIKNLLQSKTLKNSLTIFQSFIVRLVVQGVYFVILARVFEPERYGAYVGIVAIVSILIPFASFGSGEVLIQNVSRDRSLCREYWGTTILKTLVFGNILTAIILIAYNFFPIAGISIYSVFFVALANLIFLRLNDTTRDVFIAVGSMDYTAKSIIIVSINRFLASIIFLAYFSDRPTILVWCILYCVATLISAVISSYLVIKQVGYPQFQPAKINTELGLGLSFAISVSAQNIYNDLDKSMLAKLSTLEATGIYGAAYHILNVAFTPIQSLALASFRKFFQQGESGIKGSFALCKKLLPMSTAYSLLAVIGLIIFAPFISPILGSEYADSGWALVWLAPAILFKTIHFFAADTLTGANYQSVRTTAQVLVAMVNGILNFLWIPKYSWHGAIWATLVSECLLAICLWGAIYKYSRESN